MASIWWPNSFQKEGKGRCCPALMASSWSSKIMLGVFHFSVSPGFFSVATCCPVAAAGSGDAGVVVQASARSYVPPNACVEASERNLGPAARWHSE